jgi:flagellar biosynthesis protein FliP
MGAEFGLSSQMAGWAVVAALPLLLAVCTAFTKVSVVLASLRVGLGAEALLPYGVMIALSLVITAVIMGPTAAEVLGSAVEGGGVDGLLAGDLGDWWAALAPLHLFMKQHADAGELAFFAELQGLSEDHPLVLVPGFLVSELAEAMHMAVLILVPFVILDLLIAQILTLLNMQQQSPAVVSLPAKILLFLAAGGWDVILGGLVEGYL